MPMYLLLSRRSTNKVSSAGSYPEQHRPSLAYEASGGECRIRCPSPDTPCEV